MGRDPNEGAGRKGSKKRPDAAVPDFWSFHPTEAQKRQFEEFLGASGSIEDAVERELKRGVVFTLTMAKTNDSACVIARNRFDSYGEGQALSVFHSDPLRALWGMIFVLTVMFPEWPSEPVRTGQRQIDW